MVRAEVSSSGLSALNAAVVAPVEVGDSGVFSQPYGGLADEFALWNRVLTSQELTDLWNGGAPLPYARYGPVVVPAVPTYLDIALDADNILAAPCEWGEAVPCDVGNVLDLVCPLEGV
jgi:hypothetical protein